MVNVPAPVLKIAPPSSSAMLPLKVEEEIVTTVAAPVT